MADEIVQDDGDIATEAPLSPAGESTGEQATPAAPPAPDPEHWIPKYRLDEVGTQVQTLRQQLEEQKAANERHERRIRAVMGVDDPASAGIESPEVQQLRRDLEALYPGLGWMQANFQALQQAVAQSGQFGEHVGTFWNQQGTRTMNAVYGEASKRYFGDKDLTAPQREQLHSMFLGFVRQGNNTQRYEASDPTLQADFFKYVEGGLVGPARRAVTKRVSSTTGAPAVPQGGGSSAAQGAETPTRPKTGKDVGKAMLESVKATMAAKAGTGP